MDLTVVACWWGGWPRNTGRGPEYIERLKADVEKFLPVPHRFVILTDRTNSVPEGVERIPLRPFSWKGILPKIGALNPENGFKGRVIVFDLDNVPVGSLEPFAAYTGAFCVRRSFHADAPDGDLLAFDAAYGHEIWNRLATQPRAIEELTGGRERYAYRLVTGLDTWDTEYVASYKLEVRQNGLRPGVRVVCFHGDPRPHEVAEPWMKPWTPLSS